jgi:ABC-2 type transport system ATP-binding protein
MGEGASASSASGVAIRAEGLVKSFGARPALVGVDLEVSAGTVLGLLGPNAAGKTTLVRVLTTVLRADAGSFMVAGESGRDPLALRRRVGLLPESSGLPPGETGAEVLTFHARMFGQPPAEARAKAERLLEVVGLGERAGTLVSGYSRGMRQRLGIARALVNDPAVVFLDEPTLGLDPGGQRQILDYIATVANEAGVTVVLSTHVLAEVEDVCDRVVILNRGAVVAEGSVADVARRAAAPRRGRVTVPPGHGPAVVAALRGLTVVDRVDGVDGDTGRGEVEVELRAGVTAEQGSSALLAALAEIQAPVLGFDLERGRLSDAFLELTGRP